MTPEEDEQQKRAREEIDQILNKDLKKFVDGTRLYFGRDYFALRLNTGEQPETFALTPYLAKILSRVFAGQVKNYEDYFGPIQVDLSVPSPIQMSDLQGPGSDESVPPPEESPQTGPKKPKK